MAERRRYHPQAFDSAVALVCRATSMQTARIFEALIRARSGKRSATPAGSAGLGAKGHTEAFHKRLYAASSEFDVAFGTPFIRSIRPSFGEDELRPKDACSSDDPASIWLAPAFLDVLDRPLASTDPAGAPEPDILTETWISIASACPTSGRGHHLALRCLRPCPREPSDIARLVAARTGNAHLIADDTDSLELAVLRAELHGGSTPAVVVVDRHLLSEPSQSDADAFDHPSVALPRDRLSAKDSQRLRVFRGLRNTYVWRAPQDFSIDGELAAFFGGAIGPLVPTHEWRDAVITDFAPGIGRDGVRALSSRVADPRDAGALAACASVVVSVFGIDLDDAATLVANSLSPARPHVPLTPQDFDARLVVCDEEGQLLLARATELARQGARILFWGPPGGGKSTFAQALAAAMGRGAQTVTAAAILARGWGVTERIIADLWSQAADDGTCLIIDEIDSLCGVREPVSSGNAYLVRSLTNEFLRAFDLYHTVPVIATANHLEAIDEAVRRRFTFVINVQGELTPEAERLAWHSIFDVDPPPDWAPIGANVSDFANAMRRCRILGLLDAQSLAAAVERSREARLGPVPKARRAGARLQ